MNYIETKKDFQEILTKVQKQYIENNKDIFHQPPDVTNFKLINEVLLPQLLKYRYSKIKMLSNITKRNVIIYYSPWLQGTNLNNLNISINDYDMNLFMSAINKLDQKNGLDIVLHTPGGDISACESIVRYLRKVFNYDIRVIIPQIAMSCGTMIACSGKQIIVGKQSSLGPVDPQIFNSRFGQVSCEAIVEEFERLENQCKNNVSQTYPIVWNKILEQYFPTLVDECRRAIIWAKELVSEWLKTSMFAEDKNNDEIVSKIIKQIASHEETKTHSRHFDCEKCKNIGLKIIQMEDDKNLQDAILSLHHAVMLSFDLQINSRLNVTKIVESNSESFSEK